MSFGTPVFERDWDVLLVLDGCRPDTLADVASDYEFLPADIATSYSVGSCSWEWLDRNFTTEYADEAAQTTYVSANPYTDDYVSPGFFRELDEVWQYGWDAELGTVPARAVTDRAITARRADPNGRLIAHYMQPHFPSIPEPLAEGIDLDTFGEEWHSVWEQLERSEIAVEDVEQSFRANLEYVLDDVELLLENLDAEKVIITADHANAFGEWGLYGHPVNKPAPVIRRVPWVVVSGADYRHYEPEIRREEPTTDQSVEDRLRNLGYR